MRATSWKNEAKMFVLMLVTVVVCTVRLATGQPQARMVRLPAPLWTGSPADPAQHVYYDPRSHQVVVVPAASGLATEAPQRFDLQDGARPSVYCSVVGEAGAALTYSYRVTDDPNSPQRTKRLDLLLPNHDSALSASGPWTFATQATSIPDRTATVPLASMRWAYWDDPAPTAAKIVGLPLSLNSTYLPGFADAVSEGYVQNPVGGAALAGFDTATAAQLQIFLDPPTRGNLFILLAPLFRPGASRLVIAANYSLAIQQLARGGSLAPSSPYVQEEISRLGSFLQSQGEIPLAAPKTAAGSPAEMEIQQAMSIALK